MSHFFSSLYYLCISLLCIWLSSVHVKVVLDRLLFELARKKFDPENSSVTCAISLTYSANNKMLLLCALLCYCCHLSRHLQSIFFIFSRVLLSLSNEFTQRAPRRLLVSQATLAHPSLLNIMLAYAERTNFPNSSLRKQLSIRLRYRYMIQLVEQA